MLKPTNLSCERRHKSKALIQKLQALLKHAGKRNPYTRSNCGQRPFSEALRYGFLDPSIYKRARRQTTRIQHTFNQKIAIWKSIAAETNRDTGSQAQGPLSKATQRTQSGYRYSKAFMHGWLYVMEFG